jgi:hypothetical protein
MVIALAATVVLESGVVKNEIACSMALELVDVEDCIFLY